MIPKKIHYCWFGGAEKSKKIQRCIASWKRYCPDYEIVEWNESNFDLDQHPYLRWCHDNKKWAFLSDFARLLVVYEHGGIYFDTDVELVRNPDELLQYDAFYGFENCENVATGLGFGAYKKQQTLEAMIEQYAALKSDSNGKYPCITCPQLNTKALLPFGLRLDGTRQHICGAEIFPIEYFNPYDDPTGTLNQTKNTISIHWYAKTWMDRKTVLRSQITKPFHKIFGTDCFRRLKR